MYVIFTAQYTLHSAVCTHCTIYTLYNVYIIDDNITVYNVCCILCNV